MEGAINKAETKILKTKERKCHLTNLNVENIGIFRFWHLEIALKMARKDIELKSSRLSFCERLGQTEQKVGFYMAFHHNIKENIRRFVI